MWKRILCALRRPRGAFLLCFYAVFAALLAGTALLLALTPNVTALHAAVFALTAAGLAYAVYTAVLFTPKTKAAAVRLLQRRPFTAELIRNYGLRTVVFSSCGFAVSVAYAALQAGLGIAARSLWNVTVAGFYFVLIALRGVVLFFGCRRAGGEKRERRIYALCGGMLNLLTPVLAGLVVLAQAADLSFAYAGIMIYFSAAYTFGKIVSAAVQFFRARRQDSLTVRALRNINLVTALYSVLVLQIAMLQAFGEQSGTGNALLGGAIALLTFIIGLAMIVRARMLRRERRPPETAEAPANRQE